MLTTGFGIEVRRTSLRLRNVMRFTRELPDNAPVDPVKPAGFFRDTRGAELLEFALALPLIIVMVAGLLDFANAYNLKQKLANAAREGARVGSSEVTSDITTSNPASVQAIKDDVTTYLQDAGVNTSFIGTTMSYDTTTFTGTYYTSSGGKNYGLKIERYVTVVSGSTVIPSTRVTLRYPYNWTFGFNHIIKLLVPSADYAGTVDIETYSMMADLQQ